MSFEVRGAPINVVATFSHYGMKFQLSRPVERGGQRRRQGWMLSYGGTPMAFFADCDQAEIVACIKNLFKLVESEDDLRQAIFKTIADEGTGKDFRLRTLHG